MKKLSKKNNPSRVKNKFEKVNEKIDAGKKFAGLFLSVSIVGAAKRYLSNMRRK